MLPPLLTTLSLLHNSGVVHRAISPDTIYVTDKGELLLTAFSIAAVRTANTELECEIYNGYAAPEQYSANGQQGTWTDVYAVCAVIYRVLTGSMPPSAISRMENDNLVAPAVLNPNVPRHVSNVIMQGLNLNGTERTKTVTELVTRLFDEHAEEEDAIYGGFDNGGYGQQPYANQQPYADEPYSEYPEQPYDDQNYPNYDTGYSDDYAYDDYQEEDNYRQPQKAGAVDRLRVPIIVGIVLLLILLIVVFVVAGDLFKGDSSESSKTTTAISETTAVSETQEVTTTAAVGDSVMPQLLGKNFENAKTQYASWITFDAEEVFSDQYAAGQICWQEYEVGDTFDSSKKVKVQVSKGSATVEIPSYSGSGHNSYGEKLDELNIPYTESAESSSGYSNGSVIRIVVTKNGQETDLGAGDSINLNDKYQVIVYYAYNPEPETTAPPETEPVEETTAAPAETVPEQPPATEPAQTAAPAQ